MKRLLSLISVLMLAACTLPAANNTGEQPAMKRMPVSWEASDAGTREFDMPLTKLTLKSGDAMIYETQCNGSASSENLEIEGSIASIQCWFAGGGDQYAVFVGEAEQLTVKHRTVDEEAGFGEWETVK